VVLGFNKLDDRCGIDEKAGCFLAEDIDIMWTWPILSKVAVALVVDDIG